MHIDTLSQFTIKGQVFDEATEIPLSKVKVTFVDTGVDSTRSEHLFKKEIGESDLFGKIDIRFEYWWGQEKGVFKKKSKKTFSVELSREGYTTQNFDFSSLDSENSGNSIVINLSKVHLKQEALFPKQVD